MRSCKRCTSGRAQTVPGPEAPDGGGGGGGGGEGDVGGGNDI